MAYRYFGGDPVKDAKFIDETMQASNLGLIPNSRDVFIKRLGMNADDWVKFVHDIPQDLELLDYIKQLGQHYKTGLLSNAMRGGLGELFAPGVIEQYFDVALASGDVGVGKPDARFYQMMVDQLGVTTVECIFTDDKPKYCRAAVALGMQTIVYTSFAQFKTDLESLLKEPSRKW